MSRKMHYFHDAHSDATQGQIDFLDNCKFNLDARRVLYTMSTGKLFRVASLSFHLCDMVMAFVNYVMVYGEEEEPGGGTTRQRTVALGNVSEVSTMACFTSLPSDIVLELLDKLCVLDQIAVGCVSQAFRHYVSFALEARATKLLRPFNLTFSAVRLMLAGSGSVVAGSACAAMLHVLSGPVNIQVFTRKSMGERVARFLCLAAGFPSGQEHLSYTDAQGCTYGSWILRTASGQTLTVFESTTRDPLLPVFSLGFSSDFRMWTGDGFWHAYPSLTLQSRSLTTRQQFPLNNYQYDRERAGVQIRERVNIGYSILLGELDSTHRCGVSRSCPATLRRTDDGGCLRFPFTWWRFEGRLAPLLSPICWTLGGVGCTVGILNEYDADAHLVNGVKEHSWRVAMIALLHGNEGNMPRVILDTQYYF